MAKPNYQHVKRQKEAARKARQQEKLQRKQARTEEPAKAPDEAEASIVTPVVPT